MSRPRARGRVYEWVRVSGWALWGRVERYKFPGMSETSGPRLLSLNEDCSWISC